ncbi:MULTISPECIES: fumarate/nitrate reduction transcriptional regulator Fnr [Idiomarinaceae]|uniref:Fumarate/nitrate reduction transcriptional regulator Fnr n=2 Tax=Pseudidiomarina TaxID=2800384 RepID=A0AB39X7P1_9GAMM|nr:MULTISPECIES: fumarate/nitrate reduction transcriptional regulator Fnr [Idiomarinaceae]MDX1526730.1 fumarate/nitrate reduction transcriptional regulator Fnr [Pseudidiomarina maritima]MDT7526012.1 fumarate/nitrate reduction transcriptional regulator Fnr [Pseudidiomarina sp. GXY010]MRJ41713.1 fumarate/nitrate reduction transcriptional regulator Fnr [Idiomarina sp. FeN1]NCU57703.1 fumarate/nitrate reduction transcriptional regulator Fnr [Idiomarina sp. FenA--70]NCU60255.1 fumarate/nitrate redu
MANLTSHIHCQNCSMAALCLPYQLDQEGMNRLDTIIQRHKPLHKRDVLVNAGAPLKYLYAVRSGSLKSYTIDDNGVEQIIDFHLPGDLVGFDALAEGQHRSYSQALETTMLCEVPIVSLDELVIEMPSLRKQMMRLMSSEIFSSKQLLGTLNNRSAHQRLAHFLVTLSDRFKARGLSSTSFRLTMTRADIGNYLGLSVETISRILSALQGEGVIDVQNKLVNIIEPARLRELAH